MATKTNEPNVKRFVTGEARLSYADLWVPTSMEEGQELKYKAAVIIPKSDKATVKRMLAAYEAAKEEGIVKYGKTWNVDKLKNYALKDGDVDYPEKEEYEKAYVVSAKNPKQPGMIDRKGNPITEKDEMYSGVYGFVELSFYPYSKGGGGIGCMLENIMKSKDGEAFSSTHSAQEAFKGLIEDGDGSNTSEDDDSFM